MKKSGASGVSGVRKSAEVWAIRWVALVGLASGSWVSGWAQGSAEANNGFDQYVAGMESRVSPHAAVLDSPVSESRPGAPAGTGTPDETKIPIAGEVAIEKLTPGDGDVPGGMLHHWRGTAFAPGARAADFEQVMQDVGRYPEIYAPQVVSAKATTDAAGRHHLTMRVKQKHVITVVMDTDYDVTNGRTGPGSGWSASRSTAVREIADAGTDKEHALGPGQDHGFLWRLNSYWTYEERDGGLLLRLESVSLTREIPAGLAWAVRPFIESVPKESLEFSLRKTVEAVERQGVGSRQ
jgi:hypothetical protein